MRELRLLETMWLHKLLPGLVFRCNSIPAIKFSRFSGMINEGKTV